MSKVAAPTIVLTDAPFMTAEEKMLVLKQWKTFLKKLEEVLDMPQPSIQECDYGYYPAALDKVFTEKLYKHLSLHCSFIAHFSRRGFLAQFFAEPAATRGFLSQFDRNAGMRSVEMGGTHWISGEYRDINTAMIDIATPKVRVLYSKLAEQERQRDLALARALAAKHGVALEGEGR